MKTSFDEAWQDWIAINMERDCNINDMYDILVANDFCPTLIKNRLQLTGTDTLQVNSVVDKNHHVSNVEPQSVYRPSHIINANEGVFLANAEKIATENKLQLFKMDNFLNAHECYELLSVIRGSLRESTITNQSGTLKNYRTSKTCDLSLINHPLVNSIDQRICDALGIDASYSEPIQAQWYDNEQEFKAHTDYFEPNSKEFEIHAKVRGQRTWTFMIYLNNTLAGGATNFSRVKQVFLPKRGTAVIWNNLTTEGKENIESMHCGMPVENGFKVIITKWFRLKGKGKQFTKKPNEYLPCYTDEGFLKTKLPKTIFSKIYNFYKKHANAVVDSDEKKSNLKVSPSSHNQLMPLEHQLKQEIQQLLQPLVEAWFGHYLKPSRVEEIRIYENGCVIKQQRQDSKTSIVSVIINIEQLVNQPWPLLITDHNYREHRMLLSPGDMLFYESAKLNQGRPVALDGDEFADLYIHYQLP